MKKRVIIGLSGGIDSSVSAYLLKKEGFEVTGVTFRFWEEASRCCNIEDIQRARRFADKLGIPYYIFDLKDVFEKKVVRYFIEEYLAGRTPNPCVVCNAVLKFPELFNKMKIFGYDYIATGHYARIIKIKDKHFFAAGKDKKKSQEYFLARVKKELLPYIIFPLGELTKKEVREIASKIDFEFKKEESQEVCFIKRGTKYYEFVNKFNKKDIDTTGIFVDKEGKELGKYNCYFKYTIGQREGIGISGKTPYYIKEIKPEQRKIVIGRREEIYRKNFIITDLYWYKPPEKDKKYIIRIRYNHSGEYGKIKLLENNEAEVIFETPQFAITPGQLAVIYEKNYIIGSGWIKN